MQILEFFKNQTDNKPFFRFGIGAAIWLFCIGLIRSFHSPFALDIDGAEQMYLSQWLESGFGIQPPLPTWLLHFLFEFMDRSVAAVQFFRLSTIFFIYLGFYRLSKSFLMSTVLALSSTLSLVFIIQFSAELFRQMHTVFVILAVVYAWISILSIIQSGNWKSYLSLGFWVGIGLLSKYTFVIHMGVMLITILSFKETRHYALNPKIFLTMLFAFLICSPHYLWLLNNMNEVNSGIQNDLDVSESHNLFQTLIFGLGDYLLKLVTYTGLLAAIFLIFFYKSAKPLRLPLEVVSFRLLRRYLVLSLIALVGIIVITSANVFHEHWLQPFFIVFPILLFSVIKDREEVIRKRLSRFNALCIIAFFPISLNYGFKSGLTVLGGKTNSVFNVPYKGIAEAVKGYEVNNSTIMVQDVRTAGHLKMLLPDRLVLVNEDVEHLKREKTTLLENREFLFLWKDEGKAIVPLNERYLQMALGQNAEWSQGEVFSDSVNYYYSERPYPIRWTIITAGE